MMDCPFGASEYQVRVRIVRWMGIFIDSETLCHFLGRNQPTIFIENSCFWSTYGMIGQHKSIGINAAVNPA